MITIVQVGMSPVVVPNVAVARCLAATLAAAGAMVVIMQDGRIIS